MLGRIGFDKRIVDAMVNGRTIIEHSDGKAKEEITGIWNRLIDSL
jgi:MinD superfamily P-loop ATPase